MAKMNFILVLITAARLAALACLVVILNVVLQSETIIKSSRGDTELKTKADNFTGSPGSISHQRDASTPTLFQCPSDADPDADAWKGRDCKKRLPSVICIGFERCGTDALSLFLSTHPTIKHTIPFSVFYWNQNKDKGISWYLEQMPVSSKHQLTMEKTSSYIYDKGTPGRMSLMQPETILIIMVCDPVHRAMSEFLHLLTRNRISNFFEQRPIPSRDKPIPFLGNTFETSVVDVKGNLYLNNSILAHGLYEPYLQEWLKFFPMKQILILDGTAFKENPIPLLQEVEDFLGIIPYFDWENVYFDGVKGFFCPAKPSHGCLGKSMGKDHRPIEEDVVMKLRKYYRPYNERLEILTGRTFSWA